MSKELRFISKEGRNYEQPKKIKLVDNGDVYQGLSGLDKNSFNYRIADAKFITYMDVFKNRNIKHASGIFKLSKSQNLVLKNDILFTASSETPDEVGIASVYTGEDPIYLNSFCFGWRSKLQRDNNYMVNMLASPKVRKSIVKLAQGSTRYNLSKERLINLELPFHEFDEQQKIGSFLGAIDEILERQSKKLNKLLSYKLELTNLLLPKDTSDIPKIRFKEFHDSWENLTLGDLGNVVMCRRIFKNQTSNVGEVPFYKIGTFGSKPDSFITKKLFEDYKSKYPFPKKGDILISASGSIGKIVEYNGDDEYFQDSNIVWLKHDKRLENSYLKLFYSNVKWFGLEGSTIKRLYNKNILNTKIKLPSILEQKKIGTFLNKIEELKVKEEKVLNIYNLIKKYYLSEIFSKGE